MFNQKIYTTVKRGFLNGDPLFMSVEQIFIVSGFPSWFF